jgi:hypothetical protein
MRDMRRIMLVAVIAFAAAIGGVFAGRAFVGQPRQAENELHGLLHDQLKLSVEQHAGIDARTGDARRQCQAGGCNRG